MNKYFDLMPMVEEWLMFSNDTLTKAVLKQSEALANKQLSVNPIENFFCTPKLT